MSSGVALQDLCGLLAGSAVKGSGDCLESAQVNARTALAREPAAFPVVRRQPDAGTRHHRLGVTTD